MSICRALRADSVSEQKLEVCDFKVKSEFESSEEFEFEEDESTTSVSFKRDFSSIIVFSDILDADRDIPIDSDRDSFEIRRSGLPDELELK